MSHKGVFGEAENAPRQVEDFAMAIICKIIDIPIYWFPGA